MFFALALILADFAVESFAAVVLAAVAASVIGRAAFGYHPFLALPAFSITSPAQYLCYAVLGVLAAGVGIGFSRVLYLGEDLCGRLWHGPEWLRPAVGGLLLGGLLLALPQVYGLRYPVLGKAVPAATCRRSCSYCWRARYWRPASPSASAASAACSRHPCSSAPCWAKQSASCDTASHRSWPRPGRLRAGRQGRRCRVCEPRRGVRLVCGPRSNRRLLAKPACPTTSPRPLATGRRMQKAPVGAGSRRSAKLLVRQRRASTVEG